MVPLKASCMFFMSLNVRATQSEDIRMVLVLLMVIPMTSE